MAGEVSFREVLDFAIGGGWGDEVPRTGYTPVRVIRGTDFSRLANGAYEEIPSRYEEAGKAERRRLLDADIVLEISGGSRTSKQSTGRSVLVRQRQLDALGPHVIPASFCRLMRVNNTIVSPQYAYYALQDMYASGRAAEYEQQSTGISNFQFEFFLDQETFRLPPLPEQKRIAHILGTLDDKIELNRRMNATLEDISRAIFKSWFIDFDPVRQKAAGKQPVGVDAQTAALFPDSFENSEIGEVPKGWRAVALQEVADIMSGGTPLKSDAAFWGGEIPWISPKVMTQIHVDGSIDRVTQAAIGNGTRLVPAGAVLVMVRGMGLHDGVRVSQAKCPVTFNQDVKALVAKGIPAAYLLYRIVHESSALLTKVQSSGHGTGVLPTEFLSKVIVVVPGSEDGFRRLVAYIESLDSQNFALVQQGRALAALRDTLLPQLLSGAVRVPEAEEAVEEVLS